MKLNVIHKDQAGTVNEVEYNLSFPALIKHVSLAGEKNPYDFLANTQKAEGFAAYYYRYFDKHPYWFHIVRPNKIYYDPTEIGQFSNLIGKGIGDFLARRISGAIYTHTYEAALLCKHKKYHGDRPDFYCDTGKEQFALEAKGFSSQSVSDRKMSVIKKQAQSGPIKVNFSIASAAYSIFDNISCKYYDPNNNYEGYDYEDNVNLSYSYYSDILNIFNEISNPKEVDIFESKYLSYKFYLSGIMGIKFLFNRKIIDFLNEKGERPKFEKVKEDDLYIDNDGIGVEI